MRSDLLLCEKMTALSPNKDAGGERDPQASGPHVIAPERSAGAEAGEGSGRGEAARWTPPGTGECVACARDAGSTSVPGWPRSQSKLGGSVDADRALRKAGWPS